MTINPTISFRPLHQDDFPLLLEWLQRPHVKEWWNDGDDTLEKVREHYSRDPVTAKRFILLLTEKQIPAGCFQYYFESEQIIGIDQFLSEPDLLGGGIGAASITQFSEMIRAEHSPSRIIIDPHPANARAIRCAEKIGFRHYKSTVDAAGKPAYLMELVAQV